MLYYTVQKWDLNKDYISFEHLLSHKISEHYIKWRVTSNSEVRTAAIFVFMTVRN
jgi:hypothetical protein